MGVTSASYYLMLSRFATEKAQAGSLSLADSLREGGNLTEPASSNPMPHDVPWHIVPSLTGRYALHALPLRERSSGQGARIVIGGIILGRRSELLVTARQTFVYKSPTCSEGMDLSTKPWFIAIIARAAARSCEGLAIGATNENHSFSWCNADCVNVGRLYFNSRNASSSQCRSLRHSIRRASLHRPDSATDYAQGCNGNTRARLHAL